MHNRAQAALIQVLEHAERIQLVFPADLASAASTVARLANDLHTDLLPDHDTDPDAGERDVDPNPFLDAARDLRLAVAELTRVEVA